VDYCFFFSISRNDFLLFIATYHRWPIPSTGQSQCVPPFRSVPEIITALFYLWVTVYAYSISISERGDCLLFMRFRMGIPISQSRITKTDLCPTGLDQFAKYMWPTRSTNYSATFTRGRGKWTLPATFQWHAVHLTFGLWPLRCNSPSEWTLPGHQNDLWARHTAVTSRHAPMTSAWPTVIKVNNHAKFKHTMQLGPNTILQYTNKGLKLNKRETEKYNIL